MPEPLQPPGTDAFRFEWKDPGDAAMTWERDDMHAPFALSPLAGDYFELIGQGFAYRYEKLGLPARVITRIWNGYAYVAFDWGVPEGKRAAIKARNVQVRRAAVPLAATYWRETAMPELREIVRFVTSIRVGGETLPELAAAWDEAWRRCERAWKIHFYAITGPYQALDDLADVYESVIEGGTAGEALRLIHGSMEELQAVERGMDELARLAAFHSEVAAYLRDANPPTKEGLVSMPAAGDFVLAVDAFLAEHGHMGQGFDDLSQASWSDEPERILVEVAKRLQFSSSDADARRLSVATDGAALAASVRERLADRPEDLERFNRALSHAQEIGPLTEGHNYWIDRRIQAILRRFSMEVGRRLVEANVIADPTDILFLHRAELPELLRRPSDRRDVIATRRAEHARQLTVTPPGILGMPPADEPGGRFDGERGESTDGGSLKGTGASAGKVRGPARVTLSPDDFGRVRPGDVIVCPSSNPSWIPLFAIAAGLVTDTGGVLSHAAVVAREFGLPAVVGTGDATTRISDGQIIELDGTTGDVRLR